VDLVLAGHVHAYERTHPVGTPSFQFLHHSLNVLADQVYRGELFGEAPTYINVGTGGTHEGHANRWFAMPNWSLSYAVPVCPIGLTCCTAGVLFGKGEAGDMVS